MDHKNLIATDIHTHAEVGCRNPFGHCGDEHDRVADKYIVTTNRIPIEGIAQAARARTAA